MRKTERGGKLCRCLRGKGITAPVFGRDAGSVFKNGERAACTALSNTRHKTTDQHGKMERFPKRTQPTTTSTWSEREGSGEKGRSFVHSTLRECGKLLVDMKKGEERIWERLKRFRTISH